MNIQIDLSEESPDNFDFQLGAAPDGSDVLVVGDVSITFSDSLSEFLAKELAFTWLKAAGNDSEHTAESFFDWLNTIAEQAYKEAANGTH